MKRYDDAKNDWSDEAFGKWPQWQLPLFAIAKEYEQMSMPDQAEHYYLTLRKANPSYVGLYYHLARLYEDTGKVEDALNIYDEGIFMANKMRDQHALAELKNAKMNLELMM